MLVTRFTRALAHLVAISAVTCGLLPAWAQQPQQPAPAAEAPIDVEEIVHKVTSARERINLQVNRSRILAMDLKIPRAAVENPEILDLKPLSANQVQIHSKKTGVTTVTLWDENNKIHTIEVVVYGDVRELDIVLKQMFPNASIKLLPTTNSVILSGHIEDASQGPQAELVAKDYFPKVINALTVGGTQQVLLHVHVMEISRTKLRDVGFDFANVSGNGDFAISKISGLLSSASATSVATTGAETFAFGIIDPNNSFFGLLVAMQRDQFLRVLAEPTLSTVSGRPAYFQVGGEIPILIPQSLGTVSIEFRRFGTQVDFVPIVLGNGNVRLEVRPRVSEIDNTISVTLNGSVIPGFRTREVDTAVELQFGQTFALAGLIQTKERLDHVGIPWLKDLPVVGMPFRRATSNSEEVELLILVRPEPAAGMDCHEVPPCGPGMFSGLPNDCGMYIKGNKEVPKDCPGGSCVPGGPPVMYPSDAEMIGPGQPVSGQPMPGDARVTRGSKSVASGGGRAAPANQRTRQVSTPRQNPKTRYNRSMPPQRQSSGAANANSSRPGFIGATGYDVQN